jgi:uncharacterized protein YbjT (DUF2867 family)
MTTLLSLTLFTALTSFYSFREATFKTEQSNISMQLMQRKEAGVKHILYTSVERRNENGSSPVDFLSHSHIYTEKIIKESGIPYTIFRNNLFMDMLPVFLGEEVVETGVYFPAEEGKLPIHLEQMWQKL